VLNTFAKCGVEDRYSEQVSQVAEHLITYFGTGEAYEKLPHASSFLQFLSAKERVVVGAISNTDPRIANVLKEHNLGRSFSFVLDCYTAGISKPNPEIFKQAAELSSLSDLSSSEILHIGDSVKKDYQCALKAGCRAMLVAQGFQKDCADCGISADSSMFEDLPQLMHALNKVMPN